MDMSRGGTVLMPGGRPGLAVAPGRRCTGHRPAGRVRLTRRGRAVVVALFLLLAGLGAAVAAPASRAADQGGEAPTAVVRPGDTLWSITERCAPGRDPFGVIEEIRQLNGLTGYTVYAGQRLVLPGRG